MLDKQFRGVMLVVENTRHQRLLDLVESTICHGDRRCCTGSLTRKASLAEELPGTQNGNDCFPALFGNNREFYLASPEVEQGIRRLSLLEDVAGLPVFYKGFPAGDFSKQRLPMDRLAFAVCHINLCKLPRASVFHQIRICSSRHNLYTPAVIRMSVR